MTRDLYFSIDIETDGPVPMEHSMLSFGCVALTRSGEEVESFEANLKTLPGSEPDPATMRWWKKQPDAWRICRANQRDPEEAIVAFCRWVDRVCTRHRGGHQNYKAVAVCYPAAYDFSWLYAYMMRYHRSSPFGFRCIDVRSYIMAMWNKPYCDTAKRNWPADWFPNIDHTHVAIDDAREQGLTFINAMNANEKARVR